MKWQTLMKLPWSSQTAARSSRTASIVKDGKLSVSGGEHQRHPDPHPARRPWKPHSPSKKPPPRLPPRQPLAMPAGNGPGSSSASGASHQLQRQRRQHLTLGVLRAERNGTYTYAYEGSMSVQAGSTASQSGDAGAGLTTALSSSASRAPQDRYYNLVKRNPQDKGTVICLNDACYVTFFTGRLVIVITGLSGLGSP